METLRYVVLVNGLLAVVSLAYYVLLRRETFFSANRLALWIGFAGAIVLPLLELPDWRPQRVRTVMHRTAQIIVPKVLPKSSTYDPPVTITFPNQRTYRAFHDRPKEFVWSWQMGLIALYIVGVILLLGRFGVQLLSLRKLISRSSHESYRDFTLVINERVTSPFSFFDWVVLNPNQHTTNELDQILRHERVHVRERHSLDMIGAELVCIIFWLNPAAYLFRHLLQQTLEFSADRTVLAEGIDAKAYQYNLLKVSMATGQSSLTNHFSKSQLKSRIVMINRHESTKATWVKYPVFFIAALTVASAFARQEHVNVLAKYVPKPITEAVTILTEPSIQSQQQEEVSKIELPKSTVKEPAINESGIQVTTEIIEPKPDTVQVSPSRYMQYEGDKLYWVITPKTSFDDLVIMKQEFERHGYKMQIQTLKYDPLNMYIADIRVTIIRPTAGTSDFEETGIDGGPIRAHGGFNGLNNLKTVAAVGSYPFNENFLHVPQGLIQLARDEELFLTKFIHDNKMNYLLLAGKQKYGSLGIGFRRFDKEEIKKQSSTNSSVRVNADSSITINEIQGSTIKTFINNEPVSLEEVHKLSINQVYTMAVILGYDSAKQKRTGVDYLLFYINKAK